MRGFRFGTHTAARLAESLARAIEEHGAPNSFAPSELALRHTVEIFATTTWKYRPARAMDYGRHWDSIVLLMSKAGYGLVYSDRRFEVSTAPGIAPDGGPT